MRTNEGHRQRVKQRFLDEGMENFEESHALELLLFYAVPRIDTKPIARRLLDRFGSFAGVLDADMAALKEVEGVGPSVAAYIHTLHDAQRYYELSRSKKRTVLEDMNDCGAYVARYFHGATREKVYLLCLDSKSSVICCREVGSGDATSSALSTRLVVEAAMSSDAVSVVLAHNHPGGMAIPSNEDVVVTMQICATLSSVGVRLVDHIIVADGDFVSLVQSGYFKPQEYQLMLG